MRIILNLEVIMAEYLTEQKKTLAAFLARRIDTAYSIEELIEELRLEYGDRAPGKSTVYRLITKLVDEGSVKRFVKGNSRTFLYQAIDCSGAHAHLHLRCTDCGKLIHLDHSVSDKLVDQVALFSDFSVSEAETVLLGKCKGCKELRK